MQSLLKASFSGQDVPEKGAVAGDMVARLRTQIAAIEKRPMLAGQAGEVQPVASAGLLAAAPGLLHEVFTDESRNRGALLGFTLAQGQGLLSASRPALFYLQLVHEAHDSGLPYGAGLKSFGIDPEALVIVRVASMVELLWAMEEAICCRAVAGVIADVGGRHKELDFTASRRLSLRTAATGTSAFLIRYDREREASAAKLRWRVMPELSASPRYDPRASGRPRWRVVLEKGRLGKSAEGEEFLLDWTDNGFVLVDPGRRKAAPAAGAPLFGALSAELGYRLSEAS
jgi:protein ImuA